MDKRASIADVIDRIASETGAPPALVDDVRRMFAGKGISLEDDAEPFATAIRETFLCDAVLREQSARAKQDLARLRERLVTLQRVWTSNAEQLERVRSRLADSARTLERHRDALQVRRSLVPGPRAVQ